MPTTPQALETPVGRPVETKRSPILMIVLILILSLGSTAFFAYQNMQLQKQIAGMTKISSSPLPVATTDPTAGWKVYIGKNANYQFSHPSDWTEQDASEGCGPVFSPPDSQNTWLTICGLNMSPGGTANGLATRSVGSKTETLVYRKNITLDNKNAVQQQVNPYPDKSQIETYVEDISDGSSNKGILSIYFYMNDPNKLDQMTQVFSQILSTFKFTQ